MVNVWLKSIDNINNLFSNSFLSNFLQVSIDTRPETRIEKYKYRDRVKSLFSGGSINFL